MVVALHKNRILKSVALAMILLVVCYTVAFAVDVKFEFDTCAGNGTPTITSSAIGSNYDIQISTTGTTTDCFGGWVAPTTGNASQMEISLVGNPAFILNDIVIDGVFQTETLKIAPNGNDSLAETLFVPVSDSVTFTPAVEANFTGITSVVITNNAGGNIVGGFIQSVEIPFTPTAVELESISLSSGGNSVLPGVLLAVACLACLGVVLIRRRKLI